MLAQPCRDHRGPGLFERQAADRVDHLDGARAGGTDEAFAGDPDNLLGVRESDSSCGGQDLQRSPFDAAVAVIVVGGGDRDLGHGSAWMRASSVGWLDFTIIR